MDEVVKVLKKYDCICFVIYSGDNNNFWLWEISEQTYRNYFYNKGLYGHYIGKVTKTSATIFLNDSGTDTKGCSIGSFDTIEKAIDFYFQD